MIAISPLIGISIAIITIMLAVILLPRRSKFPILAIVIGIVAMALALFIQSIFQEIPFLSILLSVNSLSKANAMYVDLEKAHPFLIAAYLGIMAGFWQEGTKLLAVKYNKDLVAHWVGFGFAVVDIAIFLFGLLPSLFVSDVTGAAIGITIIGIILQAPFSMMFHTGTAAFLKDGLKKGKWIRNFLVAAVTHSYVDGMLDLVTIETSLLGFSQSIGEIIVWLPSTLIGVAFFAYLLRYLRGIGMLPTHPG